MRSITYIYLYAHKSKLGNLSIQWQSLWQISHLLWDMNIFLLLSFLFKCHSISHAWGLRWNSFRIGFYFSVHCPRCALHCSVLQIACYLARHHHHPDSVHTLLVTTLQRPHSDVMMQPGLARRPVSAGFYSREKGSLYRSSLGLQLLRLIIHSFLTAKVALQQSAIWYICL